MKGTKFAAIHRHGLVRLAVLFTCTAMLALPAAAGQLDARAPAPAHARAPVARTGDLTEAVDASPRTARTVIGTAELARTRTTLTAIRTGRYTATVRLRAAVQTADGWKHVGSARVGKPESWFWFVVSRAEGVCSFSIGENPRRMFGVRLAESTSIGCELGTREYVIRKGELVRR